MKGRILEGHRRMIQILFWIRDVPDGNGSETGIGHDEIRTCNEK